MKMYFKKNGKLTSQEVNLNSSNNGDIAKDLGDLGLYQCRKAMITDKNSLIMAIVK